MITGTSITVDETAPRHRLSLHTMSMSTTLSKEFDELQLWELGCLLHVCTQEVLDLHHKRRPPCQCTATGESQWCPGPKETASALRQRCRRPSRNWNVLSEREDLNLRHLHFSRDPNDDLHNRDIVHCVDERQLQNLHSFLHSSRASTRRCTQRARQPPSARTATCGISTEMTPLPLCR